MEEGKKCCGVLGHLWHRKSELLGGLLIVLAAIATLLSFSGLGLFGMFLAGFNLFLCFVLRRKFSLVSCVVNRFSEGFYGFYKLLSRFLLGFNGFWYVFSRF